MARDALVSMRNNFSTAAVEPESSLTNGPAALASQTMGRDTQRDTTSGYNWPMRLGTSSPKMMVVKVMIVTTRAVAEMAAAFSATPQDCSQPASPSLKAASPTMPLSTPIEVMPTCTVDKNWFGLPSKVNAACAPLSPSSAMALRRDFRLAANASSDMANTPLSSVKKTINKNSMGLKRQ